MFRIAISLLASILIVPFVQAKTVNNIEVAEHIHVADQSLILKGAGIRSKFFMKLYVGALYLNEDLFETQAVNSDAIVSANEAMTIRLHITSSLVDGKRMSQATHDGFMKATGGDMAPIQKEVEQFIRVFLEGVEDKDIFDLQYIPGAGVSIVRNGDVKALIPGLAFKKALFSIWLSDPALSDLKKDMLGES